MLENARTRLTAAAAVTAILAGTAATSVPVAAAATVKDSPTCAVVAGTIVCTSAPVAPDLRKDGVTSHTASVSWQAVEGADRYEVETSTNGSDWMSNGTQTGTVFAEENLAADADRYYRVRSINDTLNATTLGSGNGAWSPALTARTAPAAPVLGLKGVTSTTATIEWAAVAGADRYELETSTDGESFDAPITVEGTEYLHTDRTPNGATHYRLRALGTAGTGDRSATLAVTTAPGVPAISVTAVTETSAVLEWAAVDGAASYELEVNGTSREVATAGAVVDGLAAGSVHNFRIRAHGTAGAGDWSAALEALTIPAAPVGLAAILEGRTALLTWDAVHGAAGYEVVKDGAVVATTAGLSASVDLPAGSVNEFTVQAVNASGISGASNIVHVSVPAGTATGMVVNVDGRNVTVNWGAADGADGYEIVRDGVVIAVLDAATLQYVLELADGETATIVVRSLSAGGNAETAPVTVTVKPAAAAGVRVQLDGNTATVTWDAVSGATGYTVTRDNGESVETTDLTATFQVADGDTATFTVTSRNAGGSTTSAPVSVTAAPAAPVADATISGNTATVSWAAVNGATSYTVTRDGGAAVVVDGLSSTFQVADGDTATFVVTARNTGGAASSAPVSVTVKPAAPVAELVLDGNTATVSWAAVNGATSYTVARDGGAPVTATGTSHTFTVADGDTATFVVTAHNTGGAATSAPVSVTVKPAAPVAIVTLDGNTATVSWAAVNGATSYTVARDGGAPVTATGTSHTFTVADGDTATFVVTAHNTGGAATSAPVSVTVKPAAPQALTTTVTGRIVTLNWAAVNGATSYDVHQDGVKVATVNTNTAQVELADGQTASFAVQAVNGGGVSPASAPASATIAPRGSIVLTSTVDGRTVTLAWDAINGAEGYHVYQDGRLVETVTGTTTSRVLAHGQTAEFVVQGYNKTGTTDPSTTAKVTIKPAAPANVTGTVDTYTATVTWDVSAGANGYSVYKGSSLVATVDSGSTTSARFSLSISETATFSVTAHNTGGTSETSVPVTVTAAPAAVTNLTYGQWQASNGAGITWDAMPAAEDYTWRNVTAGTTGSLTGTKLDIFDLPPDPQTYEIRSRSAGGATSPAVSVVVQASHLGALQSDNPQALYRLGVASGLKFPDWVKRSADGTFSGTPTWQQEPGIWGTSNTSVGLSGDDRASLPVAVDTAAGAKNTVEFWMKWDGSAAGMPFGFHQYDLYLINGHFGFNTGNADLYGMSSAGMAGRWVHVVAVFTNGKVTDNELYIDGVKQTLTQRMSTPSNVHAVATNTSYLGGWGVDTHYGFRGLIDELSIYNKALTGEDARQHYRAGLQK